MTKDLLRRLLSIQAALRDEASGSASGRRVEKLEPFVRFLNGERDPATLAVIWYYADNSFLRQTELYKEIARTLQDEQVERVSYFGRSTRIPLPEYLKVDYYFVGPRTRS